MTLWACTTTRWTHLRSALVESCLAVAVLQSAIGAALQPALAPTRQPDGWLAMWQKHKKRRSKSSTDACQVPPGCTNSCLVDQQLLVHAADLVGTEEHSKKRYAQHVQHRRVACKCCAVQRRGSPSVCARVGVGTCSPAALAMK